MTAAQWLAQLLALFGESVSEAEFRTGYRPAAAPRLPERPVVTGEVDSEVLQPGSREIRLKFRIFLPPDQGPDAAEEIFSAMCALAAEQYPGFSAIARSAAARDSVTGLLEVPCTLSFLSADSSGGSDAPTGGRTVTLGGRELTATGIRIAFAPKGTDLVSIGEETPFARAGELTEYTVELEGIETLGLDRLAAFTAVLGDAVYENCRWKSLSLTGGKASFVSSRRTLTGGDAS